MGKGKRETEKHDQEVSNPRSREKSSTVNMNRKVNRKTSLGGRDDTLSFSHAGFRVAVEYAVES